MDISYVPLVGTADEAKRIHVHVTTMASDGQDDGPKHYEHAHAAEEAVYFLEGRATVHLEGKTSSTGRLSAARNG